MSVPVPRIYLASRSPRRRELLTQIGVKFDTLFFRAGDREDAEVDETPLVGETVENYVVRIALAKASHGVKLIGLRKLQPRLVLAADTTVDVDGDIIGKPRDTKDAEDILQRMSGRSHRVLTTVAIARDDVLEHRLSISDVRFRELSAQEIRRYVQSGEPMDKAGAYGIQGMAGIFVEEIRGSQTGIMGLPLCETALLLRKHGFPI